MFDGLLVQGTWILSLIAVRLRQQVASGCGYSRRKRGRLIRQECEGSERLYPKWDRERYRGGIVDRKSDPSGSRVLRKLNSGFGTQLLEGFEIQIVWLHVLIR